MKMKILTLATALIFSAVAHSQTLHWLEVPEGTGQLEAAPCAGGGKEATFISKSNTGPAGAYGCWTTKGANFVVVWTTLMGQDGSPLKANFVQTFPVKK
jgi:hypothetical protein